MEVFNAAPCFSGNCGLCSECTNTINKRKENENIQRAQDYSKFWTQSQYLDELNAYSKEMNQWCKKWNYSSPINTGNAPRSIQKDGMNYKLICKNHNIICDDIRCKSLYVSTHENIRRTMYPKFPVYKRISDTPCNLCSLC